LCTPPSHRVVVYESAPPRTEFCGLRGSDVPRGKGLLKNNVLSLRPRKAILSFQPKRSAERTAHLFFSFFLGIIKARRRT
jgi:hypothetical protein